MTTTKVIFDGKVPCGDCGQDRDLRIVANSPPGSHPTPVSQPVQAVWGAHACTAPTVAAPFVTDPRVSQPQ